MEGSKGETGKAKACTILLRGGTKDVLNEVERNLQDAMQVAAHVITNPRLVPGGGATEMALSRSLQQKSLVTEGMGAHIFKAVSNALEVIPTTLANNCGCDVVRALTELRSKTVTEPGQWGLDGNTGEIKKVDQIGIWEPIAVKTQSIKTSIESSCMLLRIDDIVSGIKKKEKPKNTQQGPMDPHDQE